MCAHFHPLRYLCLVVKKKLALNEKVCYFNCVDSQILKEREKKDGRKVDSWVAFFNVKIMSCLILPKCSSVGVIEQFCIMNQMELPFSDRLDLWTTSSTGCACPDGRSNDCACCVQPGGCLCSFNSNKCAQCGLEDACQRCKSINFHIMFKELMS